MTTLALTGRESGGIARRVWVAAALGALFVAAAMLAFGLLLKRDREVVGGVRENAVWGAYQLDREAVRFRLALSRTPRPRR